MNLKHWIYSVYFRVRGFINPRYWIISMYHKIQFRYERAKESIGKSYKSFKNFLKKELFIIMAVVFGFLFGVSFCTNGILFLFLFITGGFWTVITTCFAVTEWKYKILRRTIVATKGGEPTIMENFYKKYPNLKEIKDEHYISLIMLGYYCAISEVEDGLWDEE